jgi:hypothetical protein
MRLNKMSGKMFNYWTEGGFIAWGQDPDPKTGRIPLQLFMDGRAQAAYDVNAFDLWTDIMSGGPLATVAAQTGRELTAAEYRQIGDWISEQLKKHNVWAVLMPNNQFDRPFTYGLEYSTDWRIVFLDDKQKLFVSVATTQGNDLYQGMFTGRTQYPDQYFANLSVGHNLLLFTDPDRKQKGLDMIIEAFKEDPSPAPMIEILMAAQFSELRPRVDAFCAGYAETFEKNKAAYARQDGYNLRLEAARLALIRLERLAQANGDRQLEASHRLQRQRYGNERDHIFVTKKW